MINRNNYTSNEDPILKCKVENSINIITDGKLPGNANISNDLITYGGKCIAKIYTTICQNIWKTKVWQINGQVSNNPYYEKGDSKKCPNYRSLSLIPL